MKISARKLSAALTCIALAASFAACGTAASPAQDPATASGGAGSQASYKVGITQFLAHPSLDSITKGIKDALSEKGLVSGENITYVYDDAQGEPSNTTTIAGKYAADPSLQLLIGIATPSAQSLATAITDRPVLFAGVTDPVTAGIVPSWDKNPTSNVTGTSDLNPEGKPFGLIKEAMGDKPVKKIGYLYTLSEANSKIQLKALQDEAGSAAEIVPAGLSNASELATAIQTLSGVDAIYVGTDNTVVTGIDQVISFCNEKKIPLFTGDDASVEKGAVATRGIDYYELGKRTGEMVYEILVGGKKAGDIPPLQVKDTKIYYNAKAAQMQGLVVPQAFLDKVAVNY